MGSHRRGLVTTIGLLAAFLSVASPARAASEVTGGDPIQGAQYRCTAGVNVVSGGTYYFVTAGHCGNVEPSWYTLDGDYIGGTVASSFPSGDSAVVQYQGSVGHPGTIGSQDVTSAGDAHPDESVCMRGGTSGVRCGSVVGVGVTATFGDGTVESGLVQTDICGQGGDGGAPLYDGTTALGILVGTGSGGCVSYFRPLTEILAMYGLSVY